jgi:hypothetical protein
MSQLYSSAGLALEDLDSEQESDAQSDDKFDRLELAEAEVNHRCFPQPAGEHTPLERPRQGADLQGVDVINDLKALVRLITRSAKDVVTTGGLPAQQTEVCGCSLPRVTRFQRTVSLII